MNINRPRLKMIAGNDRMIRSGFSSIFNIARIKPAAIMTPAPPL
jgi:hypothetical protein